MKRNLLLTPGPTKVPDELLEVLGRPIIHHRTPQFQEILKETVAGLQRVLQTKNDVYLLASSGTGAMEAAIINLASPGEKIITVNGGKFGERWGEIAQAFGINPVVIDIEWGTAITADEIKKVLKEHPDAKGVFVTLCETSTAVTPDIKALGHVVKDSNAAFVVDAVSGLGAQELRMDDWYVDVVASGSHKGFMLPPGVGIVSVSDKAYSIMDQTTNARFYFDLRKSKKAAAETDTPFTPAINLVIALNESVKLMEQWGVENMYAHFRKLSCATRKAMEAIGLTIYTREDSRSDALTAINVPDGIDGGKFVKIMRDTHGITFAGGQGHLKGKIFRMAHMGCLDEYDTLTGIAVVEKVLHQMGYKFEMGAGVAAAQQCLNDVCSDKECACA